MTSTPFAPPARWQGIPQALLLGLALLALSFSRIVGDVNSLAFQHRILDSVLAGPIWGTALGKNIAAYALTLVAIHVAFSVICWSLAAVSKSAWPSAAISVRQWLLIWFTAAVAWLLIANATLYPNSSLGSPYADMMRSRLLGVTPLMAITALLAIATSVACARALIAMRRRTVTRGTITIAAAVVVVSSSLFELTSADPRDAVPSSRVHHVILIGIDSLRPNSVARQTVSIAQFLEEATTFSDAITPLARTFPAWVSVLTGRHPHTTGAVMNLLPRGLVRTGETLPETLRRAGYTTTYAIDEVRFSNIDASYGFDKVVAPPMGATEFLLSRVMDTPLSNLIMNTRLGAIAFPHLHANRGAAATYDPDAFVRRLESELNFDRPTFLALHLTLAHWPFVWSDSRAVAQSKADFRLREYAQAVARVDEQFGDVMRLLTRKGALDNAVVILFSDHGEALGENSDSSIPPSQDATVANIYDALFGHGTSVFSPTQYQVVLGIRSYGSTSRDLGIGSIDIPVSLEDIAPTVVELLGLAPLDKYDGLSLVAAIDRIPGSRDLFADRVRFTETEFNPPDVFVGGDVSASAVAEAALFYRVDPTTDRVELREERLKLVLERREYAAILGDDLLAALPEAKVGEYRIVAVDRYRGFPRAMLGAPVRDSEPRLERLWRELHSRFDIRAGAEPVSTGK